MEQAMAKGKKGKTNRKRDKKAKRAAHALQIGGVGVPEPLIRAVLGAVNTPIGRDAVAGLLVAAAAALVPRQAKEAVGDASAAAAHHVGDAAGSARETAAGLLRSAADAVRTGSLSEIIGERHPDRDEQPASDHRNSAPEEERAGHLGEQGKKKKDKHALHH
jgi:hypothetical protein